MLGALAKRFSMGSLVAAAVVSRAVGTAPGTAAGEVPVWVCPFGREELLKIWATPKKDQLDLPVDARKVERGGAEVGCNP